MTKNNHEETMRAYRIDPDKEGFSKLHMVQENIPSPGRGEVLVRVRASSINYIDTVTVQKDQGGPADEQLIPLSDGAGDIIAVGEDVDRFKTGDRVASNFSREWFGGKRPDYITLYGTERDGWLSDYKALHAELLVSIPDHLTYEQAATLPCAAVTAWNGLHGPKALSPGDTVLTLGSGGVSVFAIQLATAMGQRVIATTSSDEKAKKLRSLGADEIINHETTPDWGETVQQLTDGRGAGRVIEVGGPATIRQSLQATSSSGEIALIGFLGASDDKLSYFDLFTKAALRSIAVGSRNDFEDMNQLIATAGIVPIIDRVFAFTEAQAAFQYLASQKHLGKIVISHES